VYEVERRVLERQLFPVRDLEREPRLRRPRSGRLDVDCDDLADSLP
jgi:hypothetical protein